MPGFRWKYNCGVWPDGSTAVKHNEQSIKAAALDEVNGAWTELLIALSL